MTIALQKNHTAVLKELLASGEEVNVNTKDDEGRSLLSLLCMGTINSESIELIKVLL